MGERGRDGGVDQLLERRMLQAAGAFDVDDFVHVIGQNPWIIGSVEVLMVNSRAV